MRIATSSRSDGASRRPSPPDSYSLGSALRKHNIRKPRRLRRAAELRKTPSESKNYVQNLTLAQKLADGSSAKKNFNIYYELDGEEVGTALRADEYGGDEDFSWVMLEPEAAAAEA